MGCDLFYSIFKGLMILYSVGAENQGLCKRKKYNSEIQAYLGHNIFRDGKGPWRIIPSYIIQSNQVTCLLAQPIMEV